MSKKTNRQEEVDKELTRVVNKDASILSTPNFVSSDFRIASSSVKKKKKKVSIHKFSRLFYNKES